MTTTPKTAETLTPAQPRFQLNARTISLLLAVIGILVSGYLSYTKLTNTPTICITGSGFNCDLVQSSVYSKLLGIPIAYLGFGAYLALGLLLLLENRIAFLREYGIMLVFGIALFGFLYSVYLTYIEAFVLQAWCQWCVISAVVMTLLFALAGLRLKRSLTS